MLQPISSCFVQAIEVAIDPFFVVDKPERAWRRSRILSIYPTFFISISCTFPAFAWPLLAFITAPTIAPRAEVFPFL